MTDPTTAKGYFEVKLEATSDFTEGPADLEVTASVGEFEGVNLAYTQHAHLNWSAVHESFTVSVDQARQLRDALDAALAYLDAAPAAAE
jgi:hypothetical protein